MTVPATPFYQTELAHLLAEATAYRPHRWLRLKRVLRVPPSADGMYAGRNPSLGGSRLLLTRYVLWRWFDSGLCSMLFTLSLLMGFGVAFIGHERAVAGLEVLLFNGWAMLCMLREGLAGARSEEAQELHEWLATVPELAVPVAQWLNALGDLRQCECALLRNYREALKYAQGKDEAWKHWLNQEALPQQIERFASWQRGQALPSLFWLRRESRRLRESETRRALESRWNAGILGALVAQDRLKKATAEAPAPSRPRI